LRRFLFVCFRCSNLEEAKGIEKSEGSLGTDGGLFLRFWKELRNWKNSIASYRLIVGVLQFRKRKILK
jgi:hypothetical protein